MCKKILIVVTTLILSVNLTACGKENVVNETKNETTTEISTAPKDETKTESTSSTSSTPVEHIYDFRKENWGDNQETVKKKEGETDGGNDAILLYEKNICGQTGRIVFSFDENGLYSIIYDITNEDFSTADWVRYYKKVKEQITKEIGEPYQDAALSNDKDMEVTSQALKNGDASLFTTWQTDTSSVIMQLMHDEEFFLAVVAVDPTTELGDLENMGET